MGPYGQAMRNPFGGNGRYGTPGGGVGLPGQQYGPPVTPYGGGAGGGGFGGAIRGVLGGAGNWIEDNPMGAYLGASAIGGAADYFERRGERNENKRRYEEAIERDRKHREAMGRSLGAAWGG